MGRHDASAGGRQPLARTLRPRRRDHDSRRRRGCSVPPGFRKAARRARSLVRPDRNEHAGRAPAGFRGPRSRDVSEDGGAAITSRSVFKCVYGSAPRAALIRRVFQYMQSQTDSTAVLSERVEKEFVDITPHPLFARLEGTNQWMAGRMIMFRRVLVRRRVAAADVPARQTQAQMQPTASAAQTIFTALRAGRHVLNLIQMTAFVFHFNYSIEFAGESASGRRT